MKPPFILNGGFFLQLNRIKMLSPQPPSASNRFVIWERGKPAVQGLHSGRG